MAEVVLGIGGNIGDQRRIQQECMHLLLARVGRVLRSSGIYWNAASGYESERLYTNRCVLIETELQSEELLTVINAIEQELGRVRVKGQRNTDRTLDIDIISIGSFTCSSEGLTVPHPRMHERPFVLIPFQEVSPVWNHPVLGMSVVQLINELN